MGGKSVLLRVDAVILPFCSCPLFVAVGPPMFVLLSGRSGLLHLEKGGRISEAIQ